VDARRGSMEAQSKISAANNARVIFGLEPPGAQLNAAGGQSGESPFEFSAPYAVAGHENHQIGKPARRLPRFPTADPILEMTDRFDHEIEILVGRPARRTNDECNR